MSFFLRSQLRRIDSERIKIILLSRMRPGQVATVIQLPAATRPAQEASEPQEEHKQEERNQDSLGV